MYGFPYFIGALSLQNLRETHKILHPTPSIIHGRLIYPLHLLTSYAHKHSITPNVYKLFKPTTIGNIGPILQPRPPKIYSPMDSLNMTSLSQIIVLSTKHNVTTLARCNQHFMVNIGLGAWGMMDKTPHLT